MVYIPVDIEEAVRRECRRRRYSERTIKTYIYCINRFLKFAKKDINRISKKDVRLYLESLSEKGMAGNTMNVDHMAIRFLFEDVLDKRIWIDIKYSKVPEKLPVVLSKEEVKKLFNVITNPKHRLMVQLMYSAGLRVSELINLRIGDINLDKNYGWVRGGKGNKDRLFIVADSLKDELHKFMKSKTECLFTSGRGGRYNIRSLQQIIKKAAKSAGIKGKISPHTLRHSFATHLIENGYSVSEVQSLLGHKSPETTFVYLHTASPSMIKIKSPIDNL
ncbi:MAG: tyrosine-type recombinase/integrase [Candidatus Aenigmarchaeota archaeon]|nr:tyrosine-type recombinase/integrase [Candidatus Aenigmarchaeota archaeon]